MALYLHFPNTPSWRGAQLKKVQGQLYLLPLSPKMSYKPPCPLTVSMGQHLNHDSVLKRVFNILLLQIANILCKHNELANIRSAAAQLQRTLLQCFKSSGPKLQTYTNIGVSVTFHSLPTSSYNRFWRCTHDVTLLGRRYELNSMKLVSLRWFVQKQQFKLYAFPYHFSSHRNFCQEDTGLVAKTSCKLWSQGSLGHSP
jgi:hypothetical protein